MPRLLAASECLSGKSFALLMMLVIASGLPAQETLSPPEGVPTPLPTAGAAAGQLPNPAALSRAPAPSLLQTMATAKQGFCARWRNSPLGQLVANMRKPLSAITGGLVPAEKKPHPDEQAQHGPQGTAAQVKAAKLEAPARQAAIQSLAGVDVRYHPEAEAALIAALRSDPEECVRLQAAKTIRRLPVCSPALLKALQICFEGKASDGNPAELSPQVRWHASLASNHCQSCQPGLSPSPEERPEYPPETPSQQRVAPASAELPQRGGFSRPAAAPFAAGSLDLPITRSLQAGSDADAWRSLIESSASDSPAPLPFAPPRQAMPLREVASPTQAKPRTLMDVFRAAADTSAESR